MTADVSEARKLLTIARARPSRLRRRRAAPVRAGKHPELIVPHAHLVVLARGPGRALAEARPLDAVFARPNIVRESACAHQQRLSRVHGKEKAAVAEYGLAATACRTCRLLPDRARAFVRSVYLSDNRWVRWGEGQSLGGPSSVWGVLISKEPLS